MAKKHLAGPSDVFQLVVEQAREIASLKSELERRDGLIQHNPTPTWLYSIDSLEFIDVNDAAVAAYGWSRDEFLSMTIADIRPSEDIPALIKNVARMRDVPGGTTGPWRHRHKDGTIVDVIVSFQRLYHGGKPARLIVANDHAIGRDNSGFARLSRRERQVFGLVAQGYTSEYIARELALSPKSVETYRARCVQKLGLRTRADIVRFALENGILVPKSR
jgi:PAS domain S-box-containing protein